MGIHSREYYRDASRSWSRGFGGGGSAPVVKWLILANVAVFILQLVVTRATPRDELQRRIAVRSNVEADDPRLREMSDGQIEELARQAGLRTRNAVVQSAFELDPRKTVYKGQVWRLITHAFCHSRFSLTHIVFNMLFLWWFGVALESMYGSREFLLFYLAAAMSAAVCFLGLAFVIGDATPAVGASGAVMGVMILFTIHYPRHVIHLFFLIPIEIRWVTLFVVIYDLHPVLLQLGGDVSSDGVAHAAHLGGVVFGALYWKSQWRLERLFGGVDLSRLKRPVRTRKAPVRLYEPPPEENLEAEVDRILAKITAEGEASLTERERRVLVAASEKYKRR